MPRFLTFESKSGRTHQIPAKFVICGRCNGEGTHDHPAFSNGITSSEWAEWDDDDRDHYLRGDYDVACECCEGGKKLVVDEDACYTKRMQVILAAYREQQEEFQMYEAERRAERRMGA
jgi:hypothetical protein